MNWISAGGAPSWSEIESAQLKFCVTQKCVLKMIRKFSRPVECFVVKKLMSGVGATTFLHHLAWQLQNNDQVATCFIFTSPSQANTSARADQEFLSRFEIVLTSICRAMAGNVVICIDDGLLSKTSKLQEVFKKGVTSSISHLTIVHITSNHSTQAKATTKSIPFVSVASRREDKNSSSSPLHVIDVELSPFLGNDDLWDRVTLLTELFPDSTNSLNQLYEHSTKQDVVHPDRHIFVLLLTALRKKFEPIVVFLNDVRSKMNENEQRLADILSLLSAHSPCLPHLSYYDVHFVCPEPVSALFWSVCWQQQDLVSFLHPYLALLWPCEPLNAWVSFSKLELDFRPKIVAEIVKSLFTFPRFGQDFSSLVEEIRNGDQLPQLIEILQSRVVFDHAEGHHLIVLSRLYLFVGLWKESIDTAVEAEKELTIRRTDRARSFIGLNNLCQSLSAVIEVHETKAKISQLSKKETEELTVLKKRLDVHQKLLPYNNSL